jgi:hypothetical protein
VQHASAFQRLLSVFDPSAISQTFCRSLASHSNAFLVQDAAAWMVYHYLSSHFSFPDLICASPTPRWKKIFHGPSVSERLAQECALFLKVPFHSGLLKTDLTEEACTLRKEANIEDKKVLLIQDALTSDFFKTGEALAEGFPQKIWGLTLI